MLESPSVFIQHHSSNQIKTIMSNLAHTSSSTSTSSSSHSNSKNTHNSNNTSSNNLIPHAGSSTHLDIFLKEDFDPLEYARSIISHGSSTGSVEESLARLGEHRDAVNYAIASHVSTHNDELIQSLETISKFKSTVSDVQQRTRNASKNLDIIKKRFQDPLNIMKQNVNELKNVQQASEILRKVRWFLTSVSKLKSQLISPASTSTSSTATGASAGAGAQATNKQQGKANTIPQSIASSGRELAKVCQIIQDIEMLLDSGELAGIHVVEAEIPWVNNIGKQLRSKTEDVFKVSIEELNQAEIGSCLQAFYHLQCLPERIESAVAWANSLLATEFKEALDIYFVAAQADPTTFDPAQHASSMKSLSKKEMIQLSAQKLKAKGVIADPTGAKADAWKSALWSRVDTMIESFRTWALRIWNVQRVLCKKRDSVTHVLFSDLVGESTTFNTFWKKATSSLEAEVSRALRTFSFVKNTLVSGYPHLRRLLRAMLRRLHSSTSGKGVSGVGGTQEQANMLLAGLSSLLSEYLAKSLSKLTEPVQQMFPQATEAAAFAAAAGAGELPSKVTLPTQKDVATFAGVIINELSATIASTSSAGLIGNNPDEFMQSGNELHPDDDIELVQAVAKGCCKAINLFAFKAEQLIAMTESAFRFQLSAPKKLLVFSTSNATSVPVAMTTRTTTQQHNCTILAVVLQLYTELKIGQNNHYLQPAFQKLKELSEVILGGYLGAAASALETILSGIHKESYISAPSTGAGGYVTDESHISNQGPNTTSFQAGGVKGKNSLINDSIDSHMEAFENGVGVLVKEHISKIGNTDHPLVKEVIGLLYERIIVFYVRNVSLVRPVDELGRLRIVRNLSYFEQAVSPIGDHCTFSNSSSLSDAKLRSAFETNESPSVLAEINQLKKTIHDGKQKAINELRGLKRLLFLNPNQQLSEYTKLKESVRVSTIIHHLFASAPFELRSPYTEAKLTIQTYLKKVDAIDAGLISSFISQSTSASETIPAPTGIQYLKCGSFSHQARKDNISSSSEAEIIKCVTQSLQAYENRVKPSVSSSIDDEVSNFCDEYVVITSLLM